MEKVLDLETTDDITAIRNRIDFVLPPLTRQSVQTASPDAAQRPRLLLIVPRKNEALKSLVNMKLLARTVQTRAVDVALVSGNPTIRDYAKEAGINVFSSLKRARRAGWVTEQAPVAAPEATLPPVTPAVNGGPVQPPDQPQSRKRVEKKKYKVVQGDSRSGSLTYIVQQLGMLVLIVILAVALVLGFIGLLPQARVTLTPVAQPVETELVVKADPDASGVNFSELTFPSQVRQVELSLSGEIETIETEMAPVGRARGRVVFINRTEDVQMIPMSTTLSTSAGDPVEFYTVVTATIPPGVGATTSTAVIAAEPGPRGNVAPGQLSRFANPAYLVRARVINESWTGGGDLAPARVVVADDKPRLDAHLRQEILEEGLARLEAELEAQEFIPADSVQVIVLDKKYREFAGDFSDTFGGEMQAVVRATVIGGYNANRLALAALEAQVPPGYELDIDGLMFGAGEVLGIEDGVVTFKIFASGRAVPTIETETVAEDIAWLSIGDAQQRLAQQYDLVTVPGVELQPDWLVEWLGRLPFSPLRIQVVVNEPVMLLAEDS